MQTTRSFPELILRLALILPLLVGALAINAEEIRIPIGQQANDAPTIELPTKGMSKMRVQTQFGDPLEMSAPKGNPPISQWKYSDFVVYFESDHVIHSVRVFKPKTEMKSE